MKEKLENLIPNEKAEQILEQKLVRIEGREREILEEIEKYDNFLITSEGKRLRIIIPYLMAKGLDLNLTDEELIELFSPIELGHGTSLILDDVIDEDEKRRGETTPHTKLKQNFSDRKARSSVILDVYHLQAKIEKTPLEMDFIDPETRNQLIDVFGDLTVTICRGQILDVLGEGLPRLEFKEKLSGKTEFDYESFYLDVARKKTAPPFEAGPEFIEAVTDQNHENLRSYSQNLAIAFQIRDDVLDISGGKENVESSKGSKIGKDIYSDLKNGKLTLPMHYSLRDPIDEWKSIEEFVKKSLPSDIPFKQFSSEKDPEEFLKTVLENNENERYELEIAGKVMEASGGLQRAQNKAEQFVEEAISEIENSKVSEEYRDILQDLAVFAAQRSI